MRRISLFSVALLAALMLVASSATAESTKFKHPKDDSVDLGYQVGGVSLNHKRAKVIDRIGKPASSFAFRKKGTFCDLYSRIGLSVCYERLDGRVKDAQPKGKAGERVRDWNGRVVFVSIASPYFRTDDDVGIGSDLSTILGLMPVVQELDWGAVYDQPPTIRAVSTTRSKSKRSTYWLLEGAGTPEDPSTVAAFNFGLLDFMPTLKQYLDSQVKEEA